MAEDQIKVWRLIAHHQAADDAIRWFSQSNVIAIGWGSVGSIEIGRYHASGDIGEALRVAYPHLKNSGDGGSSLFNFCHEVSHGDLVIVGDGLTRRSVMEVTGDYHYRPEPEPQPIGDYQHQRAATVIAIDPDDLWQEAGAAAHEGQSARWTFIECANSITSETKQRLVNHTNTTRA